MAAIETNEDRDRWTAQDKYQRLRAKARVEVRMINGKWVGARIDHTNRGGAYCKTDNGKETFFVWNQVRPPPDTFDPAKPIATLGSIAKTTSLRAVPPYLDAEPAAAPTPTPPPPRSAVLLISKEQLAMSDQPARIPSGRTPNGIGNMFRERRMERNWTQGKLATELSKRTKTTVTNKTVSEIELGGCHPNDSELLGFAELFAVDLQKLIDLRETSPALRARTGTTFERALPAPKAPPPTPRPSPPPESEGFNEAAAAVSSSATLTSRPEPPPPVTDGPALLRFVETLCTVAPLPIDRDGRQQWFQLAIKLFELVGK